MSERDPEAPGSPWRAVALAVAVSLGATGAVASDRLGLSWWIGGSAAALAGALTVLALPSLPTRRATVVVLGVGALGIARHAVLPGISPWTVTVWAVATMVALILIDRADAESVEPMAGGAGFAPRGVEAGRVALVVGALVAVATITLVPVATDALARNVWLGATPGEGDQFSAPTSLRAVEQLDMTERPDLTDEVVFTVDAPRADFWRGETFDVWTGNAWLRSDRRLVELATSGDTTRTAVDPDDPGALRGTAMRQTFRLEAAYANIVFAAPSPTEVRSTRPVVGRPDGTLYARDPMGRGTTYTVTSRSSLPTAETLRAADREEAPSGIVARYAEPPVTSARVRQLAQSITSGEPTTYDKIRAIERWLGTHTKYSLDAPLSPDNTDVVDHFLFTSRLGWCEQVASSMVILARSAGIPARLATGFVPGERNALTGRFTVRERDAHAWAEVYFPGVGWQGFDPTASVPLAGEAPPAHGLFERARERVPELVVAVVVVAAAVVAGARVRRLLRARRRETWPAAAFARLERAARIAGVTGSPVTTPRELAGDLASVLDDPTLVGVGDAIDAAAFSNVPVPDATRAGADAALETATARAREERRRRWRARLRRPRPSPREPLEM